MSYSRLPTLKSLQSFEATARLGTIGKASHELHVTHSAISQNIKQLEEYLGHPLFVRAGRNLLPSENALKYLEEIRAALDQIQNATHTFQLSEEPNNITLKMVSTLALRWFIPRIPELKTLYPSLTLRLTMEPVSNISNMPDEVDAAIGFGRDNEFGRFYKLRLYPTELILVGREPAPATIEEALKSYPAIYVESPKRAADWSRWCAAKEIPEPKPDKRVMLPNSAQALEAVSSGIGVLVTQRIFVDQLINLRHLTQIGDSFVDQSEGYYFYCKQHQMERTAIKTLHDWLSQTQTWDRTMLL